jgi:hypothetical protein
MAGGEESENEAQDVEIGVETVLDGGPEQEKEWSWEPKSLEDTGPTIRRKSEMRLDVEYFGDCEAELPWGGVVTVIARLPPFSPILGRIGKV